MAPPGTCVAELVVWKGSSEEMNEYTMIREINGKVEVLTLLCTNAYAQKILKAQGWEVFSVGPAPSEEELELYVDGKGGEDTA